MINSSQTNNNNNNITDEGANIFTRVLLKSKSKRTSYNTQDRMKTNDIMVLSYRQWREKFGETSIYEKNKNKHSSIIKNEEIIS